VAHRRPVVDGHVAIEELWGDPDGPRRAVVLHLGPGAEHVLEESSLVMLVYVLEGTAGVASSSLVRGDLLVVAPESSARTIGAGPAGAEVVVFATPSTPGATGPVHVRGDDVSWNQVLPQARTRMLWVDRHTGGQLVVAQLEPGMTAEVHEHVGDELILVLDGSISDETGVVNSGQVVYRPRGFVHAVSSESGAALLALQCGGGTRPL